MEEKTKKEQPKEKDENELAKGLIDDIIGETENEDAAQEKGEILEKA